jgi:hypothetical protein
VQSKNYDSLKNYFFVFLGITLGVQSALAASGLFPKMSAATNVYVVDCRQDSEDARMTAWALQGLVNQSLAEVYVIEKEKERHMEQLKDCGQPFEMLEPLAGNNAALRTLFKKYQKRVKKMFVYDPEKDWSWYLALMSAAQQNGIPVTEPIKDSLISEFGWKGKVEDFQNKWPNNIKAYDWALTNLMPGCSKQVVFALNAHRLLPLVDYVAASKGFIFWLDFETEQAEVEKIYQTKGYGVGTSLMGYGSGGDEANALANRYGIGYVVSDLYANGSFWSSFSNKTYTQSPGRAISAVPGKIYVAITWSDGDNLQFAQNAIWNLWHDPARGTIPVGTTSSPSLQELNTPLLDWYYGHMTTNDELVAYGLQFIYGNDFNDNLFPAWCKLNRSWMEGAGFSTGFLWHTTYPSSKYTTYINICGLTGILNAGGDIRIRYDTGTPVMDEGRASWNPNDIFDWLSKVTPNQRTPVFIGFKCIVAGYTKNGMNGYTKIKQQVDRLNATYPGRFIFMLPKDLFATIRSYCHLPASP